jgi:hypothetical protein
MERPNLLHVSLRETPAVFPPARSPADSTFVAEPFPAGDVLGCFISEELILLETNIDDMTGEALAFLMERLFVAGTLDVTVSPLLVYLNVSRRNRLGVYRGTPRKPGNCPRSSTPKIPRKPTAGSTNGVRHCTGKSLTLSLMPGRRTIRLWRRKFCGELGAGVICTTNHAKDKNF